MADEKARTNWLADRKWLATLSEGARVKMREFAVIAHRIQVNQVQGTPDEHIEQIYKQNPGIRGVVDILRVAFSKRPLQSGRTIGPLITSVSTAKGNTSPRLGSAQSGRSKLQLLKKHTIHNQYSTRLGQNCLYRQDGPLYLIQHRHQGQHHRQH
jgi:hypothetical protein